MTQLVTDRQQREIEYHKVRAEEHAAQLNKPLSWDVLQLPQQRWWNAYWAMFAFFTSLDLYGKRVLVVGCGFGEDAIRLAKLGANVSACDISAESIELAQQRAAREGIPVSFDKMPAEALTYPDHYFDCILARDILHHVDASLALSEIRRVAKPGAIFVVNEIYSHSFTEYVRRSNVVAHTIYPRMMRFIYGTDTPYITEDERKLNKNDINKVIGVLRHIDLVKHFNFIVTRILPENGKAVLKLDRALLKILRPLGRFLAGRILLVGRIGK